MDWPYEVAERDHEIQNPTSAEKILLLGSYLRLSAESRVLDVACGKGGPAAILAAAYGCRITGVEIRPGFADAARERVVAAGLDGLVEIRTADGAGIELEPDTLDAALCLGAPSSGDRSPTRRLPSGRRSGQAASSRSASRSGAGGRSRTASIPRATSSSPRLLAASRGKASR